MNRITEGQKHQQQEAAYGLPPVPAGNFTHEQIEALRGVLFQHDAQNAALAREFDLNKPPTPPYRCQEYPRMLYRGAKNTIVQNDVELESMLVNGWSKTPPAAESVELNLGGELRPAMQAEAAAIDARLRKPSVADLLRKLETLERHGLNRYPAPGLPRNRNAANDLLTRLTLLGRDGRSGTRRRPRGLPQ